MHILDKKAFVVCNEVNEKARERRFFMKMTKIIALLLSVFMIVTMFAACGKSETPDVDETTPETEAPKDPKEVLKEAIVANPQQAIADAMVLVIGYILSIKK